MPTYNIELTLQEDGSHSGHVYCLYPDKSCGYFVHLSAEDVSGLDKEAIKQSAYQLAKPHFDEWIAQKQKSNMVLEGNFNPDE